MCLSSVIGVFINYLMMTMINIVLHSTIKKNVRRIKLSTAPVNIPCTLAQTKLHYA